MMDEVDRAAMEGGGFYNRNSALQPADPFPGHET